MFIKFILNKPYKHIIRGMNNMKDKKIWIFIGVVIILIILLLIIKGVSNKGGNIIDEQKIVNEEEFVEVISDGTKINKSNKLQETKKINGLEISNIRLTEKNNMSRILATVKNTSSETKGGYAVKIILLNKVGETIKEIEAYIDKVDPGETVTLNTAATVDFANAYDFKIVEK